MRKSLQPVVFLLATALAAGCATTPDAPPADNVQAAWQQRHARLRAVDTWEVKGRLAVRTRQRGGQVTMQWRRHADEHTINLYGPLGGGRVVLTQDGDGAILRDSKKATYRADTAEELLLRVAGWRVPFREMQHWVLGIPAPGGDYQRTLDEHGRLTQLRQAGWKIQFQGYRDFAGIELPDRFRLEALPGTRAMVAGGEGRISVKAVIKGWELASGEIDTRRPRQQNTPFSRGPAATAPLAQAAAP